MRKKFLRISVIFTVLLLIPIVFSYEALMSGHKKHFLFFPVMPFQSSSLVLVGSDQDPNPVLNEGRQIQLRLLTSNGQSVTGATLLLIVQTLLM
ncbi:MAG: hypothetical protein IPK14_23680 [Blastocatellia bacterium]|nr:hypothetical protein [Blastocatellia bacterium]